ncbi:TetR/AcrR family transcriptional regulator [Paenibacillus rhizovicinus]|uniref:TetR/AcrR family transcriptional regulator n=1 Tax=Paenibacillus rhizovicinus TaxID=2704463 RepID=A0A6C0P1F2_9BACL|nr:TetR/AcrR family transcriptional regulator [Paenibacillus rhizovicinus]QHW32277.1 TetR/AcrR family transcriptional regulator [Paenibacillus rhizovicinus]
MRNSEVTRERILEAAMAEFSAYGIMGARVDRIAKNAGCNKNMIYIYFENKQTLFNTILRLHLTRVYQEIDFTPEDLPGFAVRVFDFAISNPELMRLLVWSNIEQQAEGLGDRDDSRSLKVQSIAAAQQSGKIGTAFPPAFILTTVMTLATAWTVANPFGLPLDSESMKNVDALRDGIAGTVKLMIQAETVEASSEEKR